MSLLCRSAALPHAAHAHPPPFVRPCRYAPALTAPPSEPAPRTLLMFYAGWNYGVRMELVGLYKDDTEVQR